MQSAVCTLRPCSNFFVTLPASHNVQHATAVGALRYSALHATSLLASDREVYVISSPCARRHVISLGVEGGATKILLVVRG
jgi:hypothetical protein